jgi:hypothetical protein
MTRVRYVNVLDGAGGTVRCRVVESLGFVHNVGAWANVVEHAGAEKTVVGAGKGLWRFWAAKDRAQPLVDARKREQQKLRDALLLIDAEGL